MVTNSWLFIGWALLLAGVAWAEPIPDPVELPRNPPKDLDEALESFQVHRDFRIELVAGEPQVVDPVAITFDENGRLFVAEMRGYPERREEALGRIKLLEDLDGDGRYEKATTFAAGLKWPTGLVCWKGGLFVAASPDILYLEDRDGDGVAEKRTVVFSGFGAGLNRLNMQALVNGLQWGPDGRIYGSTASNGGLVKARDPKAKALNLRGSDFSFDPHSLDLRPESGTAQYGLTFDDYGRRYLCSNSRHLIAVMYSWPWNKVPGLPHPLVDIPVDGGAAEVYRISKVEPWRVVRTRWRVQGLVGGPVEGGGRATGYFTSASGLTVYRGDGFPKGFRGNVFVGDVGSNLVHRKVIEFPKNRVQPVARRAKGEEQREFLASTDNSFRPVQCANGPDGALYIVDMCRETIEHPWSIPESIKKHLDLYSGNDRGRIWRVVPKEFERPAKKELGRGMRGDLFKSLQSENGWTRDTSARLLLERNEEDEINLLIPMIASEAIDERARLAALRLFLPRRELGWLAPLLVQDASAEIRRAAVHGWDSTELGLFAPLASDPDPRVRFEFALRSLDRKIEMEVAHLVGMVKSAGGDPWLLRTAVVSAKLRGMLSEVVKGQRDLTQVVTILQAAGVKGGHELMRSSVADAWARIAAGGLSDSEQAAAVWLISRDPATDPAKMLRWITTGKTSLAGLVAEGLAKRSPGEWEKLILSHWREVRADVRVSLLPKMNAGFVLDAIAKKEVRAEELGYQQKRAMRTHGDKTIRERAGAVFGKEVDRSRKEAALHYRKALVLPGKGKNGELIFQARCQVCHRDDAKGAGPALATLRNKGAPMLLENLIAPDLEVAPQYFLWEGQLKNGESVLGVIVEESGTELTFRAADGTSTTVARGDLKRLTNLNRSLMPAGLEGGLSVQEMADLLSYLTGGK
ncbi:MAG: hypothetical protein OSB65_10700 [Roseibacillus sp.]|nr:hypothetical protein [Roseibacillus sp.]